MLGLQGNFQSKVQIYIDKIKSNTPLFNGLLLTPNELNTIKQAFASTPIEIAKIKRGYFTGTQERVSRQFPLKHYTFMDTLPGLTAEEMFSYLFHNNIELTDFQQIELLIQFYEALLILQSENIIHRDLTPTNILISPEDLTVRFVDFGLALEAGNDGTVFDYLPIDTKKEKGMIQYANGIDVKKMYGIVLMFVTNENLHNLVDPEYLSTFSFDQNRISEKYPKGRIQYHPIDIQSVLHTLKAKKENMIDSPKFTL